MGFRNGDERYESEKRIGACPKVGGPSVIPREEDGGGRCGKSPIETRTGNETLIVFGLDADVVFHRKYVRDATEVYRRKWKFPYVSPRANT